MKDPFSSKDSTENIFKDAVKAVDAEDMKKA